MKTSGVIITVVGVAVVTAFATLQLSGAGLFAKAMNFPKTKISGDVEFKVNDADGKLEITSAGIGCNKKGCFKVNKGQSAEIKFQLNAGSEWQLKNLQICKGDTKPTQPCSLDVWEQMEFAASDTKQGKNLFPTRGDGVIDLSKITPKNNKSVFWLFDQNAIAGEYFYTIIACQSDDPQTCYSTDPPIQNGGRN